MEFFTSASFFLALVILAIPAAVLGFMGRSLRGYGFFASGIMLVALFANDLATAAAFVCFLLIVCPATWCCLYSFTKGSRSLWVYRAALAVTLLPLIVYKLSAGALGAFLSAVGFDGNVVGFMGISYITFKAIQVIVEIRDGLITRMSLFDYLYFLTFFAELTSGPIDRSRRFMGDVETRLSRERYADLFSRGVLLLLIGAVYQLVIASIARTFWAPQPWNASQDVFTNVSLFIGNAFAYGIYLFFDFAGYSYMAQGASYLFGIEAPRNFCAPFVSFNLKEFWNRWNITLSTWLRDFVFMRFSRAALKRHLLPSRLATACVGYLLNMTLMGCWHGITPDYVLYGIYHGVLLAINEVYEKKSTFYKRHRGDPVYRFASWAVTMVLVLFGFALFSGQVRIYLGGLFQWMNR